jgi:hypothetical protein
LICTRGNSEYLQDLITSLLSQISNTPNKVSIGIATNLHHIELQGNDIDSILSAPPGYASTRQEALKLREPGEGIIFLDDDNLIPADWLDGLINSINLFPNHILKGHVHYIDKNFLRIPALKDGLIGSKQLHFAGMSNLYFPSFVVDSEIFAFNQDFNHGGEDTELTFKLWKNGYKFRVCDDFAVFEIVSKDKVTAEYLLKRFDYSSTTFSKVINLHGNLYDKFKRLIPRWVKTFYQVLFRKFVQPAIHGFSVFLKK